MIVPKQSKGSSVHRRLKLLMLLINVRQAITVLGDPLQLFLAPLELLIQKVVAGFQSSVIIVHPEHIVTKLDVQPMVLLVQRAITA